MIAALTGSRPVRDTDFYPVIQEAIETAVTADPTLSTTLQRRNLHGFAQDASRLFSSEEYTELYDQLRSERIARDR